MLRWPDDEPARARDRRRAVGQRPDAVRVAAFAQRKSLTGFGETPDVFEAIFEYPEFLVTWSSREISAGGRGDGMQFYGRKAR